MALSGSENTRLLSIGIGSGRRIVFTAKPAVAVKGTYSGTRLTQMGLGGRPYTGFVAKPGAEDTEISGHHPLPPWHAGTRLPRRIHRTSNAALEEERRILRALEAARDKAETAEKAKVTAQRTALVAIRADLKRVEFTKQQIISDISAIQVELAKRAAVREQQVIVVAFGQMADDLQVEVEVTRERLEDMERQNHNQDAIAALLMAS